MPMGDSSRGFSECEFPGSVVLENPSFPGARNLPDRPGTLAHLPQHIHLCECMGHRSGRI